MKQLFENLDAGIISFLKRIGFPVARLAIFIVFFWFGFLKVLGLSPANSLVSSLLEKTLSFISFDTFIILFGIYEMLIALSFLISGWERIAVFFLVPHMLATFLPLLLLPSMVWSGFLVPTLEGQYIIKNLLILALAIGLAANLKPWSEKK